jgi:hypothetical protein
MQAQDTAATVRLLIFSGRPDPEWELTAEQAGPLFERVQRSVSGNEIHPPPPGGLGYRGFLVQTRARESNIPAEMVIYRGVVTVAPGAREVHWQDTGRSEDWLLDWAREHDYREILEAAKAGTTG